MLRRAGLCARIPNGMSKRYLCRAESRQIKSGLLHIDMVRLLLALMYFLLLALPDGVAALDIPRPSGPYSIGRVTFAWSDRSRLETMSGNQGEHRELLVHIYYPADASAHGPEAVYFPHLEEQERYEDHHFGNGFFRNEWGPAYAALSSTHTHAREGVRLARGRTKFPVVVFSHGGGIPVLFYSAILENLASQGYVVAAVEHTYDGDVVVFPDGHIIEQAGWDQDPQRSPQMQAEFHRARYEAGAQDNIFVLAQLARMNAGSTDRRFHGRLDLARVAAVGHSLGGKTSVFTCAREPQFQACINLDGDLDTGEQYPAVSQPVMAIYGGFPPRQPGEPDEKFAQRQSSFSRYLKSLVTKFDRISSPDACMALFSTSGFSHFVYFDMPTAQATGPWITTEEEWERNKQIINTVLLAFLQEHLQGEKGALQRATASIPQVVLQPLALLRKETGAKPPAIKQ